MRQNRGKQGRPSDARKTERKITDYAELARLVSKGGLKTKGARNITDSAMRVLKE